MRVRILVSACLLGLPCRYDGTGAAYDAVMALAEQHVLIPACPEQLGGLSTPRPPAEIREGRVVCADGSDVTDAFERGARMTLEIAKLCQCDCAVLKQRSPSCGSRCVYDGTFSGARIEGEGVTAQLLRENGIQVFDEGETPGI